MRFVSDIVLAMKILWIFLGVLFALFTIVRLTSGVPLGGPSAAHEAVDQVAFAGDAVLTGLAAVGFFILAARKKPERK